MRQGLSSVQLIAVSTFKENGSYISIGTDRFMDPWNRSRITHQLHKTSAPIPIQNLQSHHRHRITLSRPPLRASQKHDRSHWRRARTLLVLQRSLLPPRRTAHVDI